MRRYLDVFVVTVLLVLLLVTAAYGFLFLDRAKKQARAVAIGTEAFQNDLLRARDEVVADRAFPEGSVVGKIKSSWAEGVKVRVYPPDLVAKSGAPAARPRRR